MELGLGLGLGLRLGLGLGLGRVRTEKIPAGLPTLFLEKVPNGDLSGMTPLQALEMACTLRVLGLRVS